MSSIRYMAAIFTVFFAPLKSVTPEIFVKDTSNFLAYTFYISFDLRTFFFISIFYTCNGKYILVKDTEWFEDAWTLGTI